MRGIVFLELEVLILDRMVVMLDGTEPRSCGRSVILPPATIFGAHLTYVTSDVEYITQAFLSPISIFHAHLSLA